MSRACWNFAEPTAGRCSSILPHSCRRPRAVHTFGLCPERDRCGQCLRAGGGAGGRRHNHSSQTGGQRRDLCAGASSLCPGLEVAGCLMLFLLSGLGPGIPVSDRTGAERLNASRGAVRLYGLSGSGAPLLLGQALLFHRHDQGDRPLPLGAGKGGYRQARGDGVQRRRRRLRHGQPCAGTGAGLPGRCRRSGARLTAALSGGAVLGAPLAHDSA